MLSLIAYSRTQRIPSTLTRSFFRLNSTSHSTGRVGIGKSIVFGVAAGVAGGGTLLVGGTHNICIVIYSDIHPLLGGYALYHYSGMKRTVDTFNPAMRSLGQARDQLNKNGDPSLILAFLRQAAKAYVAFLPGTGFLVDIIFNAIDQAVDTHAKEANSILNEALNKAYIDFLRVVKKAGDEHRMGSAVDILAIARNLLKDMKALGIEVEIKKHASTIRTAATSALGEIKKLEIEKHAATIGTAATSAVTSALDEVKKLEKHPAITPAVDEIKSRSPAAQESLSKISKKVATIIKPPSK